MKSWIGLISLLLVIHGMLPFVCGSASPKKWEATQTVQVEDDGGNPFFSNGHNNGHGNGHGQPATPELKVKVVEKGSFKVNVKTFSKYTKGARHNHRYTSTIEIDSNVDYSLSISADDFSDGLGNTLDIKNFGYFIESKGQHKAGSNYLLLGSGMSPSPFALLGEDKKIIIPAGFGNKGNKNMNKFKITFELGTQAVRDLNGLPELMAQYIVPGVYRGTVTLTIEKKE